MFKAVSLESVEKSFRTILETLRVEWRNLTPHLQSNDVLLHHNDLRTNIHKYLQLFK